MLAVESSCGDGIGYTLGEWDSGQSRIKSLRSPTDEPAIEPGTETRVDGYKVVVHVAIFGLVLAIIASQSSLRFGYLAS